MEKITSENIIEYKESFKNTNISKTYYFLMEYLRNLKSYLVSCDSNLYSYGNVFQGYMDFSYFYFSNDYLKSKKLRFGIVLNHPKVCFELWLFGQNADIQIKYWNLLKDSFWNKDCTTMPKYSILEIILSENPNFDNINILNKEIALNTFFYTEQVIKYLKENIKE